MDRDRSDVSEGLDRGSPKALDGPDVQDLDSPLGFELTRPRLHKSPDSRDVLDLESPWLDHGDGLRDEEVEGRDVSQSHPVLHATAADHALPWMGASGPRSGFHRDVTHLWALRRRSPGW